jgi:cobalt-zinc-cadmium efflux system outer membrane protein
MARYLYWREPTLLAKGRKESEAMRISGAFIVVAVVMLLTSQGINAPAYGGSNVERPAGSLEALLEEPVGQAPAIDSTYVLSDYLGLALRRSPELRAAFYEWRAALMKSKYAGSLPDPVLSYGEYIASVETRVGPQNRRFSLKQSYPWFGTLGAKKAMASEEANAGYQRFESERLRMSYEVEAAYNDYYYLGRDIALTRENLELLEFWEAVARTKFKASIGGHPDVIRAQVELGKLEDRLLALEDEVEPAAARLRSILDLPDTVTIPIPKSLTVGEVHLDDEPVIAAVQAYNPDLRSMQHLVQKADAGVSLAKKAYFPDLAFGVDYVETGEALNPATLDSGKDAWVVGVGVNLPIWIGKNNAKKREAVARRMEAEYKLQAAQNQLVAVAQKVVFEYDDALRKLRLYRDGLVPKAEQSLNASYAAYQAGELDFLNVLDAQRQLLDFQLALERALADLATRRAEVEMITGRELGELAE